MNTNPPTLPLTDLHDYPNKDLRILMIEDSMIDADLIERNLQRHGLAFHSRRVDTGEGLCKALEAYAPDLILADLTMPALDGIEAMKIALAKSPDAPFIFVSGTIGEERAIELLRQGATDYVLKQNLARLAPVVARALREMDARRAQRRVEARLCTLSSAIEHSSVATMITDASAKIEYVNPKFTEVTGYSREEVIGKNPHILSSGKIPHLAYEEMWRTILGGAEWRGEFHNRRKNGAVYRESAIIWPIFDGAGTITHFVAVKEDMTAREVAEGLAGEPGRIKEAAAA